MAKEKKQNLADVSILLTMSNAFRTFVFLAIAVINVRYLSKESYGLYLQIIFLLNTIMMVLSFGMPRSTYYFMPRVANKKKFVFHTLLCINTLGFVALTLIILGREQICVLLNNCNAVIGLCFLALYVFLSTNKQIYRSVLLSNHNGKTLAIAEFILSILFFISITTSVLLRMGLHTIFWGILIYYVVEFVVTGLLALKNTKGSFSEITHSECFTRQLKYILPLGLISLVAVFSSSIDRFIISYFMGIGNFALYDRGAMRIPVISGLSITVGAVIMPRLVDFYKNKEIEKLLALWHASIEKIALIVFPCFIFLFIHAQQIITLLYTDRFADSVIIFKIYLFLLLFTITIYGNIFNAANRNTFLLYASIVSVLLNALLCVVMVKTYGNIGPAIATVITYATLSIINIIIIKYILHVRFVEVFPWVFLSKLMLCSIVSGIIPAFIVSMLDLQKIVVLLICLPIYFFTYYFIASYFSLIKEDDKEVIFKWSGMNWFQKQVSYMTSQAKV